MTNQEDRSYAFAQTIAQLFKQKAIHRIVISPGARNVPLTSTFSNYPEFKCYSIVDERSAAFFALGIAKHERRPVVLVCTSGSAVVNYYPAVVEAFYTDVPLIILSADRPEHLVAVRDDQTLNQKNIFQEYVLASIHINADHFETEVQPLQLAINRSIEGQGPVHINVSLGDPTSSSKQMSAPIEIEVLPPRLPISQCNEFSKFLTIWQGCSKRLIIAGANAPELDPSILDMLFADPANVVLAESLANLSHPDRFFCIDLLLEHLDETAYKMFQPELLVTFGGAIVSKKLKQYLRTFKPKHHFHIDIKFATDIFFANVIHVKANPNDFFKRLSLEQAPVQSTYRETFITKQRAVTSLKNRYLQKIPFSDLFVYKAIFDRLPKIFKVFLSNSTPVRYAQLFPFDNRSYGNRGVNGIDGCTAAAVGMAHVSEVPVLLITGDLSFLYDVNGLWHTYVPNNFRIIVVNNGGGGIFRLVMDQDMSGFETFVETTHNRKLHHLAAHFGFDYLHSDDPESLFNVLDDFYTQDNGPKLLEVTTPRLINDGVWQELLQYLR